MLLLPFLSQKSKHCLHYTAVMRFFTYVVSPPYMNTSLTIRFCNYFSILTLHSIHYHQFLHTVCSCFVHSIFTALPLFAICTVTPLPRKSRSSAAILSCSSCDNVSGAADRCLFCSLVYLLGGFRPIDTQQALKSVYPPYSLRAASLPSLPCSLPARCSSCK